MSISLAQRNTPGDDPDPDDIADVTNAMDADTFETLGLGPSRAADTIETPSMPPPEELGPPLEDPVPQSIGSGSEQPPNAVVVDLFLNGSPGAPISGEHEDSPMDDASSEDIRGSIWAPFSSQCDWEIARWAKMHSPTSSAVSDLLAIPEVQIFFFCSIADTGWKIVERLGLSYSTIQELNALIDQLPGRPPFVWKDIVIGGENLRFYYQEIVPSLRALYGDSEFQHDLVFSPERHFTDAERKCCIYNDMHTGDWWWSVQVCYMEHRQVRVLIMRPDLP